MNRTILGKTTTLYSRGKGIVGFYILFILTLLLPAMLLVENKQWGKADNYQAILLNLFRIVTAFTIGHSLTLFFQNSLFCWFVV
ncbi:HupE/UreJ family protein [Arcicella rosea]|uniref:Uncharacterized protein n=1 Tax=Arcicella rosea TaxID=502909 RepID=A0A841EPC7_9BACT|nr:HupE/UreJ family protein [Arcicella rosea]MBB6002578.1 hypothetical protein [Arcicella rosea]